MTPLFQEPETVEPPRCKHCGGLIHDPALDHMRTCDHCLIDEAERLIYE